MRETSRKNVLFSSSNGAHLIDLALLYVSKSGSVAVGLLILPFFNRQLGSDVFGIVALIISVQSLLMLLDFGAATTVGRELAVVQKTPSQKYIIWRSAEWTISLLYFSLLIPSLLVNWLLRGTLGPIEILGCAILFWAITLQNIGQSALIARQHIAEAAILQVLGLLARHGLTALALVSINSSLACFIFTQSAVAVAHMVATRWRCTLRLRPSDADYEDFDLHSNAKIFLRAGKPLMLVSLAGAAVMQLDKVIVSSFISLREFGPYFLATTFCMVPVSVFAGPITQFFQPRLVQAYSSADPVATERVLKLFLGGIAIFTLIPAGLIWLLRDPLVAIWLQSPADAVQVARYAKVLLPGVAVGALGYIPYALLIAQQDYRFQARLSIIMTTVTLISVTIVAFYGSVLAVCVIYAIYHVLSTVASWWRCINIDNMHGNVSAVCARNSTKISVFLFIIFYLVSVII